jgi:hypothetical protein
MKHTSPSTSSGKQWHQRGGVPRPPLRTFAELAEEFGVTMAQLRGAFKASGPKPKLFNRRTQQHWYEPNEVRRWWAARNAAKEAA